MNITKEIKMKLTDGVDVLIPDSVTPISSNDYAVTVPSVVAESSGTHLVKENCQVLESDFANRIQDLRSHPISVVIEKTSGTSKQFTVWAETVGQSSGGMSPWWICTSNGWRMNLAERVLGSIADLNQCVEALVIKASGEGFPIGAAEKDIGKSVKTICS